MASADKRKSEFQSNESGVSAKNISGKEVLQLAAIRQGEPELALLLPSSHPLTAAERYAELHQFSVDGSLQRKMQYESHQQKLKLREAWMEQQMRQQQQEMPAIEPKQEKKDN